MLLGMGSAQTDEEIFAEHERYYLASCAARGYQIDRKRLLAPYAMRARIGKPVLSWTEVDLERQYQRFPTRTSTLYDYGAFEAFLLLRGYVQPSLPHLLRAPVDVSRSFNGVVDPLRQRIMEAINNTAGMRHADRYAAGMEMAVLLALTIYCGRPLETCDPGGCPRPNLHLTRDAFEAFVAAYAEAQRTVHPNFAYLLGTNPTIPHVRVCLETWGILESAPVVLAAHKQRAREIDSPLVHDALRLHLVACAARLAPNGVLQVRDAVQRFFIWAEIYLAQHGLGSCRRLDDITRDVALAYAADLRTHYQPNTICGLYGCIRRFYAFAIEECLPSAPTRNPFASRDAKRPRSTVPRYFADADLQKILAYCEHHAPLVERVLVITLLHTGIRAAECAALRASDIVQIQGRWKLHIHSGKGLKDRIIPLTRECVQVLHDWCTAQTLAGDAPLFTWSGKQWGATAIEARCRELGRKVGVAQANPHRFRHTFAVALLNYGIRETVLQKLLGHESLNMTLEYAKILDHTVETAFSEAVEQMRDGPLSWVPTFFTQENLTVFAEGDTLNWIRLPMGFCRRNVKLHCESDVKCFLCERFYLTPAELPTLKAMHERFARLGLTVKAEVIHAWIERLERADSLDPTSPLPNGNPAHVPTTSGGFVPLASVSVAASRALRDPDRVVTPASV